MSSGWERTDQGRRCESRTPDDGSRTILRTVEQSRVVGPEGRLGVGPELFDLPSSEPYQWIASARRGGGDEETRTPDPLLAKEMLFQLSYVPVLTNRAAKVVGAPGLEPGTSALSGPRSNQLSYAPWVAGGPGQQGTAAP